MGQRTVPSTQLLHLFLVQQHVSQSRLRFEQFRVQADGLAQETQCRFPIVVIECQLRQSERRQRIAGARCWHRSSAGRSLS